MRSGYGRAVAAALLRALVVLGLVAAILAGVHLIGARPRHRAVPDQALRDAGGHVRGIVLHDAAGYDRLVSLLTLGREGRLRDLMLRPAELRPGEAVLDVGTPVALTDHQVQEALDAWGAQP